MARKVGFITGASRGIGKAVAVHLARAGFDIAITARTVKEGEEREHSSTVKRSDTSPLPGSLESTADLVRKAGRECLMVPADVLDPASLGHAAASVIDKWGGVDVLVHNARYIGPGHMDKFLEMPIELLQKAMDANAFAPLILDRFVIPSMLERGGGTIVNLTSAAAVANNAKRAGEGGWGLQYAMSKAAFHKVAHILALELGDKGIRCYNVDPGFTATERMAQDMVKFGFKETGAPADVEGAVVVWLATNPEAARLNGQTIIAQKFCHEKKLLPGWDGPKWLDLFSSTLYDKSAAMMAEFDAQLATQAGKA